MNVLYLMASANMFGGTPKKTLDLIKYGGHNSSIYFWSKGASEFHILFKEAGANVFASNYSMNVVKHVWKIIKIIDQYNIDIIQSQYSMGCILGFLIKLLRPKVKVVIAFVGSYKPSHFKSEVLSLAYKKIDHFVYVSEYVKTQKIEQFSILSHKRGTVIFNGTQERIDENTEIIKMKSNALLDIAGLTDLKNIQVLIKAMNIVVNIDKKDNIYLYIAGDGPKRDELECMINEYSLNNHVFLLGYQTNVGGLLNQCDIFVHPASAEGFGIVVTEAMMAEKPIIVSNAGALPEIIEHKKNGFSIDPYNAEEWAKKIIQLIEDKKLANLLAQKGKKKALEKFSHQEFSENYFSLYKKLMNE